MMQALSRLLERHDHIAQVVKVQGQRMLSTWPAPDRLYSKYRSAPGSHTSLQTTPSPSPAQIAALERRCHISLFLP
jgi:hypothetical protein